LHQVFQSLDSGETAVVDVPAPAVAAGHVLIRTRATVISAGTERMLVEFGRAGPLAKVRQQPERARQVIEKARTDGLGPTVQAVRAKLAQPLPLGYCNAGVVIDVGQGVTRLKAGDRVASNGPHAEVVSVPANLCAAIPDTPRPVSDEAAAFTPLAAIALQGIRLAAPTLGERFVVTGLGLVGLLAVQLLRAAGCEVLGIDLDPSRVELARSFGAEAVDLSRGRDPVKVAERFSQGSGVDGVLIAASTPSSDPVRQAATICRMRGRIVLVGITGLELSREDFYEKELTFQVSCSYGPGRYDPAYEDRGHDYPLGFVRWTEQRNFEAVLGLLAGGAVDVEPLVSHRFEVRDAASAYDTVTSDRSALGVVLRYPLRGNAEVADNTASRTVTLAPSATHAAGGAVVGVIGAGGYTTQVLLPALARTAARRETIVSRGGASAAHAGRRFGFARASTRTGTVLDDPAINAVIITTRHDTHADLVIAALDRGKHVFVEKPLAVTPEQLDKVEAAYRALHAEGRRRPILTVGFNRRFAPQVVRMRQLLAAAAAPRTMVMTVNAGALPPGHWTRDPVVGGGRIIGEACHFVDLLRHLAGHPIRDVQAIRPSDTSGAGGDGMTISLAFEDGSIGTVHYVTSGHRGFPKERLDVFCAGAVLSLDNFRRLTGRGWPGFRRMVLRTQDKGHAAGVAAFIGAVEKGLPAPVPLSEIIEVHRACFKALNSVVPA